MPANGTRPYGLQFMNKTQLIDALAARIGDRRTAANAVDGLLSTIVETVQAGESVSLTGFGVFEARARAARVGRNPRTGETVAVPAATVPAFRPGTGFRSAVGGGGAPTPRSAALGTRTAAAAVLDAPAKVAKTRAKPSAPASETPAKSAAAAKTAAKTAAKGASKGAAKGAVATGSEAKSAKAKSAAEKTAAKAPAKTPGKAGTAKATAAKAASTKASGAKADAASGNKSKPKKGKK